MPLLLALLVAATLAEAAFRLLLNRRQVAAVRRHRDRVPPDFVRTVTLDQHRKAADYTTARARLSVAGTILDTAITLAWILAGLNLLSALLARHLAPTIWRELLLLALVLALPSLLTLPLRAYGALVVERRFGFRQGSAALFLRDQLKAAALAALLGLPLLLGLLALMQHATGDWWLWAWAGATGLTLAAPTLYTRVIAPLFNRFEPIADQALAARLAALLERCGFHASALLTMDASKRSSHANAFFTGFGRTKRIVLFDTLLARQTPDEIEAVLAHELGHFHHRHVLTGTLRGIVTLFVVFFAFFYLCRQPWLLAGLNLHDHGSATRFIAASLILGILSPALTPISNWISRRHEYQADDFARRQVGPEPLISALTKLVRDGAGTLTPDPIYALVNYTHPPVPLRVQRLRGAAPNPAGGRAPRPA